MQASELDEGPLANGPVPTLDPAARRGREGKGRRERAQPPGPDGVAVLPERRE